MDNSLHYNLQSKELQKFLSRIKGVMMMPNGSDLAIDGYPTVLILLNGNDYNDFKDYSIERNIIALLDHKYPILHIEMDENKTHAGLSIRDVDSGLNFRLPDQPVGDALFKFLKVTKFDDKIALMLGQFADGKVSFEHEMKKNVLLVLDGYFLE